MFTFTRYWLEDGELLSEQVKCRVEGATIILVEGAALPCVVLLEESGADYARSVRQIAFRLWGGEISIDQATSLMFDTIRLGMHEAWARGAKECGVVPAEYSAEEMSELAWMIASQQTAVMGFLFFVEQNSKRSGGKWGPIQARADVWGNRYTEAGNKARLMACGNVKMMWMRNVLRVVKQSCIDCLKMDGRIYRASTWSRYGVRPQSPSLACGGWRCACAFRAVDTPDVKCTPGRPPSLSGG